jgi:methionyl-tRNA formyltransferase
MSGERRLVYLGNLAPVAASLEKTSGWRLAGWLVEEGDEIWSDGGSAPASAPLHVKDRDSIQHLLESLAPLDLGVLTNFGVILSQENIATAANGFVNVHFGLLPGNPGRHPIKHSLDLGEEVTGLTLHRVTSEPDSGPVIAVRCLSIGIRRDASEIFSRMASAASMLLTEHLTVVLR